MTEEKIDKNKTTPHQKPQSSDHKKDDRKERFQWNEGDVTITNDKKPSVIKTEK